MSASGGACDLPETRVALGEFDVRADGSGGSWPDGDAWRLRNVRADNMYSTPGWYLEKPRLMLAAGPETRRTDDL